MQIVVVIAIQFVVMSGVLLFLSNQYYTPTGNPVLNDMVFSQLSIFAALITFFAVNIPWLLYLFVTELRYRQKFGSRRNSA